MTKSQVPEQRLPASLSLHSVMLLEDPEHVKRRKLMLPPFHGERMKGYSEMVTEVTQRELAERELCER